MSQTGVVGAVGGEDTDTINDFIVGYTQGPNMPTAAFRWRPFKANTYDDPAVGKMAP